ncbi:unnamed protein product [Echinostoma caproni]|uniref:Doublecortin domain-containing protein n=1 Tax=Echinostoma caproni TaxID=27848 RepID=A0A183A5Y0_9TREM|nr:unnamed protein product [Echinostoma caproni]
MSDDPRPVTHPERDWYYQPRTYVNFSQDSNTVHNADDSEKGEPPSQANYQLNSISKKNPTTATRVPSRPSVKTAYFYQDGDLNGQTIRLAIHPNRYRSLEALLGELTEKMPNLPSGARAIFTPQGRDKVRSLADLQNNGHYICSERSVNPRGVQMDRLLPPWRWGTQEYNRTTSRKNGSPTRVRLKTETNLNGKDSTFVETSKNNKIPDSMRTQKNKLTLPPIEQTNGIRSDPVSPGYPESLNSHTTLLNESRKICVRLDGSQQLRRTVLLRRRHVRNMSQVLHELSELFGMTVQKVYTIDGKPIVTVEDLINGPEEIVASGSERLVSRPLQNATSSPNINHFSRDATDSKDRTDEIISRSRKLDWSVPRQTITASYAQRNRSLTRTGVTTSTWIVHITSAKVHPDTDEPYLTACTGRVVLSVCSRYQTTQSVLLRSAYVRTLPDPSGEDTREGLNLPNGVHKDELEPTPFRPGCTDRFEILLPNVMEIYKIRLSHDGSGSYPEWLPAEVRMRPVNNDQTNASISSRLPPYANRYLRVGTSMPPGSVSTGSVELRFPCMQWLSRTKSDGSLVREVAAPGTHSRDLRIPGRSNTKATTMDTLPMTLLQGERAPVIRYQLRVTTGTLWNAGTEASMNVMLQGDRGDTGMRTLWNPETKNRDAFARGKVSNFTIEAVALGRLRRLSIWLDSSSADSMDDDASQWYLENILVREMRTNRTAKEQHAEGIIDHPLTRGWSCFPCYQWLGIGTRPGSLQVQLIASAGSGNLSSELIETTSLINQEDIWWQSEKWKFRPGMQLVFYSYVTGAPLQVNSVKGGQIEAQVEASGAKKVVTPAEMQPYPEFEYSENSDYKQPLQVKSVDAYIEKGNCNNLINDRSGKEISEFRIRSQPDHWIVLEAVRPSVERMPTHVYVGPEGHIVSGASGPLSVPGKLLMAYAKGVLRDQAIVWLCTSASQTLALQIRPGSIPSTESDGPCGRRSWTFELRATGPRNPDAYWRVVKLGRRVRLFEALAWPGHYLRVTHGEVNVLGSGASDCQFLITRFRAQGFICLSPASDTSKFLGMEDDGQVRLFSEQHNGSTRFYPELVKAGVQLSPDFFREKPPEPGNTDTVSSTSLCASRRLSKFSTVETVQAKESKFERNTPSPSQTSERNVSAQSSKSPSEKAPIVSERDWKVSIVTAQEAQNCSVILVVYGLKANSGPILIGRSDDEEKKLFRTNSTDGFMVILENCVVDQKLSFDFSGRAFGRTDNFCQYCREQLCEDLVNGANRETETESLADNLSKFGLDQATIELNEIRTGLMHYRVRLELQAELGWTVDQALFEPHISLVGKYGDTGRRLTPLIEPTSIKPSETERCWLFETEIEAVYLGELSRCLLGPVDVNTVYTDEERSGPMCTRVLVWDPVNQFLYFFQAGTWLLGSRSGQIHEVHLNVAEIRPTRTCNTISEETEKNEALHALYEDAHALVAAIIEKAQTNLMTFEQWSE